MSIEKDLKKDGITIIKPVDSLTVTLISKFVAEKFISALPFYKFTYEDLFLKVSHLGMYIANIPDGMSEANYFYKNSSIYFKENLSLDEMKDLTIHEFIHHFQEIKDSNGILYHLGLCDFTGLKVRGMGMNEAAVQLISSKVLKKQEDFVKYYNIEFSTISPSYYPLLCNLANQMAYLFGEDLLFQSTLYSTNKFKNSFSKLCGKTIFEKIENNFDKILNAEEQIIRCTSKLQTQDLNENKIAKISNKIKKYKDIIKNTFIDTQNKIFTSYFDATMKNIYSVQDIEYYREKLYNYKDLLGTTQGYSYFNDYYINSMTKLDEIYENITSTTSLTLYKRSFLEILLSKISKLFGKTLETEQIYFK